MVIPDKMVTFPVKPTDPVIVMINFMIERHTQEVNWRRNSIQTSLNRLGDCDGKEPMKNRELIDSLVSYEISQDRRRDYYVDQRQLEEIQRSAAYVTVLEDIIGDLTRLKLRLFGDVDFNGGRDYIKAINKMFREGHNRIAFKKKAQNEEQKERRAREKRTRDRHIARERAGL